jgi:hypothetical protein
MTARLSWQTAHHGGHIALMLGQHQVGAVFPPPSFPMWNRPTWRWTFWMLGDGISRTIFQRHAATEEAAKEALLAEALNWMCKARMT